MAIEAEVRTGWSAYYRRQGDAPWVRHTTFGATSLCLHLAPSREKPPSELPLMVVLESGFLR